MKNKSLIVLKALLNGHIIEYKDYKLKLFKPGDDVPLPSYIGTAEKHWLGIRMVQPENTYIGFECELIQFLDMCESMDDDSVTMLAMANGLTECKTKDLL